MPKMRPFMPPGTVAQELLAAARGAEPTVAGVEAEIAVMEPEPEFDAQAVHNERRQDEADDPTAVPAELLALYDEADAWADAIVIARTNDEASRCIGVPWGVIRQLITHHESDLAMIMRRWAREDKAAAPPTDAAA